MGSGLILLDTHVLIWAQNAPERLSRRAAGSIRRAARDGGLAIAAFTLLEAAWLYRRGRIRESSGLRSFVEQLVDGVAVLPSSVEIAIQAAQLGVDFAGDPGDRLIAATAIVHGLALVTADQRLRDSSAVRTVW